ncbi:MAG: chemotaxis-specific protein-glutamate methyltransferase CheB [Sphingomonadaceae bacterium]|nr:chemotaxis-specific protein-glutamate methyltransferase CheB [Sphingomonadaceae bacterium]
MRSAEPDASQPAPLPQTSVLIVDDSIVARSILERIIDQSLHFNVVGSVPSAADALDMLAHIKPEIIVLDIEMPGMNGLAALPLILRSSPKSRVLILSASAQEGGPAALEALARGAADTLVKPGRGTIAGNFSDLLLDRLLQLALIERAPPACAEVEQIASPPPPVEHRSAIAAIGIGASTGGIMAINGFFGALPDTMTKPIFITQHLPESFIPFFAEQLQRLTHREVVVAADGMAVRDGLVALAPGDGHIRFAHRGKQIFLRIDRSAAASGAMPSVDPMMEALATTYGSAACGIMFSGMGRDGVEGARLLRRTGGLMLAQDPESCVVWGMPGAVADAGLAHAIQNPMAIAATITRLAEGALL